MTKKKENEEVSMLESSLEPEFRTLLVLWPALHNKIAVYVYTLGTSVNTKHYKRRGVGETNVGKGVCERKRKRQREEEASTLESSLEPKSERERERKRESVHACVRVSLNRAKGV